LNLELIPIHERLEENTMFLHHPDCRETLEMSVMFYARVSYVVPWIGYYASLDGTLVGNAGFKGRPIEGKVEIAYATFPQFQQQGIGSAICNALVNIAKSADPSVRVMARTMPEENYSTRILKKNGFDFQGTVVDSDDGEVWEWEHQEQKAIGDDYITIHNPSL